MAYQRTKNFDRLSFLYLITGNAEKLSKMAKIAEMRNDHMSRFHNAIYMGDAASRVAVLRDVGLCTFSAAVWLDANASIVPLAYLTAKTNGLDDLARELLETAGLTEDDVSGISVPAKKSTLTPPTPLNTSYPPHWPTKGVKASFFDQALAAASGEAEVDYAPQEDSLMNGGEAQEANLWGEAEAAEEEVPAEADAWDLAAEEPEAIPEPEQSEEGVEQQQQEPEFDTAVGVPEADLWTRNSPLAADHVAAGSFETAMQLLNRQAGVVDFAPLKPLFVDIYRSSKLYLPANASMPPLTIPLRRNRDEAGGRNVLPLVARSVQSATAELNNAYALFRRANFVEAANTFRSVLQSLLLVVAQSPEEESEVRRNGASLTLH